MCGRAAHHSLRSVKMGDRTWNSTRVSWAAEEGRSEREAKRKNKRPFLLQWKRNEGKKKGRITDKIKRIRKENGQEKNRKPP